MKSLNSRLAPLGLLLVLLLTATSFGNADLTAQSHPACPTPASIVGGIEGSMAHIRYLADDALEGRETAAWGARCSAEYIAAVFREMGLEGAGPDGSYFQSFEVQLGSVLGSGNSLQIGSETLELDSDWIPFGFSSSGSVSAPLIYGGPGISMPGSEMDRYAHLDIEGKIVVVEGEIPEGSGMGALAGNPHHKAAIAAGRGAAGVLILLKDGQGIPDPSAENRPSVRIPAIAISGTAAEAVRAAAEAGRESAIDAAVEPRLLEARNVVAKISGSDPNLTAETVVIGAHYDHLGFGGGANSLAPDSRDVHNGADDNASGTSALMEVAGRLMSTSERPARTVLFIAFTAEEKGLWGSGHYVNNPLMPLEKTVAMMNMDMVGRLRENTLTVYGTGTAEVFPAILEEVNQAQAQPFVLTSIPDGSGASDHASFYGVQLPVLALFTNTHADYHRPEDDWELINQEGLNRVIEFAAGVTGKLAGSESSQAPEVTFVESAEPARGAMAAAAADGSSSGGFRASLGGIPDMTPQEFGVRFTGVRTGSPADLAGIQGGDILVEFGGEEVSDLYAYTYALRAHEPGDEVVVVVLRDGERISLTAVLGERR